MKKLKATKEIKVQRPPRVLVSEKEALKRMKDFAKRRSGSLPLLERVRVEVYTPDLPADAYRNLLTAFEEEFTYAYGGSQDASFRRRLDADRPHPLNSNVISLGCQYWKKSC